MDTLITRQTEEYIRNLFQEKTPDSLLYHDSIHTEYVVNRAREIAQFSGCSEADINLVVVAAWFHDIGFIFRSSGHEEESQNMAEQFLKSKAVAEESINKVRLCIQATEMPQNPGDDLLSQVLCDADMAYLSEDFYLKRTDLLRKEWNKESDRKLSRKAYYIETIDLFETHSYFTDYAKREFSRGKAKNLKLLQNSLEKKEKKKSPKELQLGRGVESMFRLTARNQINLSAIADNKANILISINSIILTILVSVGMGRIADYPFITIPAIAFILTCLTTIIFAILSTRPKVSSGVFTEDDLRNRKVNLLFFGNFHNMEMEDYEGAVKEMMTDNNYLYSSMIRDQYSLGKAVSRKYNLLRIAYTVFMIGLILSSVLFGVSMLWPS